MSETIYQSEALTAHYRQGSTPWTLVVFAGAGLVGPMGERPRRSFLDAADVTAVTLSPHRRSWYPRAETMPCLDAVRARLGNAPVVTYGASMGGYGAIHYAGALGARHVLALAPQYSLDPTVIRLKDDPFTGHFRPDLHAGMEIAAGDAPCPVDIIVDPLQEHDREHVRLIARRIACRLSFARHAGHALEVLFGGPQDVPALIAACLADDMAAVRARIRANKRASVSFHVTLHRALADRKPGLARWALETACALPPLGTDDRVSRFQAQRRLGRGEAGIGELRAAYAEARRSSSRWALANALGGAMTASGRSAEAAEWFRLAAGHAPHDETALAQLAAGLLRDGRLEAAETIAADLIARLDLPAAHLVRSQVLARRGDVAAAIAPAFRAVASSPASHSWRFHLASLLGRAGRAAEAEALLAGAVRAIGDAGSWFEWSRFLRAANRQAEALAAARRAVALAPSDVMMRNQLVAVLLDAGAPEAGGEEALAIARESVAVRLGGAAALAQLAQLHARAGRLPEAIAAARAAVAEEPHDPAHRAALLDLLLRADALDEAEAVADAAPGPPSAMLLMAQGRLRLRRDDPAGAIAAGSRAVALAPDHPGLPGELARWMMQAGRHDEAAAALRTALRLLPAAPFLTRGLVAALEAGGRLAEAIAACREGLAASPGDDALRARLAGLLAAAGERDAALGEIAAALERGPSPDLLAARARILLDQERVAPTLEAARQTVAPALEAARQAVALAPDHPGLLGLLARALLAADRPAEAAATARQAVALAPEAAWLRRLLERILQAA